MIWKRRGFLHDLAGVLSHAVPSMCQSWVMNLTLKRHEFHISDLWELLSSNVCAKITEAENESYFCTRGKLSDIYLMFKE